MFEQIGGQKVIEKLVNDFYHIMSTDPKAAHCWATHAGRDTNDSADKLKAFLSGWTGGPPLYLEKYGHPRLRMRHFPFSIGGVEAQEWLYCMKKALENSSISQDVQDKLMEAFISVTRMLISKQNS